MSTVRGENKIAVLLTTLPRAAADKVLARLGPERGNRLRALMEQARTQASPEMAEDVLREFEESLALAARSGQPALRVAPGTAPDADGYEPAAAPVRPGTTRNDRTEITRQREPSQAGGLAEDPVAELKRIDSEQLALALSGEHPRGVATVLSCLDPAKASEALKRLPPEVRKEVFPRLAKTASGANDVALRIIRAVVAKARAAAEDSAQPGGSDKARMMAEMLKSMERADRAELMNALEEQDGELAAAVREKLYVFDDLATIDPQSMQKILAEVDSKSLAVALKDAPDAIVEKVMANLSKRARESLTEEISYLGSTPPSQVQQARKSLVDVYQRLDTSGELG